MPCRALVLGSLLIFGASCRKEGEASDRPGALSESTAASKRAPGAHEHGGEAKAPPPPLRRYQAAPFQQSFVSLVGSGKRVNLTTFERVSAELEARGTAPSSLRISIELGSAVTNDRLLTKRITGSGHFAVADHPTATFTTSSIEPAKENRASYRMRGELRLGGRAHEAVLLAEMGATKDALTVEVKQALSSDDWRTAFGGGSEPVLGSTFTLQAKLTFPFATDPERPASPAAIAAEAGRAQ